LSNKSQLNIYNNTGKLIIKRNIGKGDITTTVDVSDWSTGLYFYHLNSNGESLQSGKVQKW